MKLKVLLFLTFILLILIVPISANEIDRENYNYTDISKTYSTYFGGTGDDKAYNIVSDNEGNIYIAMDTNSPNLYTSSNAYQKTFNGGSDIYITKFSNNGERVYSTYFGGTGIDRVKDFTVDNDGNLYFTGYTLSSNLPVTENALSKTFNGVEDAYIAVLNPTGSNLIYSSYLKGSLDDRAYGVVVDNNYNTYIVGYTNSLDFQITDNAYQKTKKGNIWTVGSPYDAVYQNSLDCFITEINIQSGELKYSSYFGGTGTDYSYGAIGIDSNGVIYIAGSTQSLDIPVTSNAYSQYSSGDYDYFITAIKGDSLIYSTYFGGKSADEPHHLIIKNDSLYLLGDTLSLDFPTTSGVYKTKMSENDTMDGSIIKFNISSWNLIFSTLIGGSSDEDLTRMAIDNNGDIYITGFTVSTDYPVTDDALQKTKRGPLFTYSHLSDDNDNPCYDAIISKLSNDGKELLFSTYYGGSLGEYGQGIVLIPNGFIVAMQVWSDGLSVSNNAFQKNHANDKTNISLLSRKNIYQSDMYLVRFSETNKKIISILENSNFNMICGEGKSFTGVLKDRDNNSLIGQHVNLKLTRVSSGLSKVYSVVSDYNGEFNLEINLAVGDYLVESFFNGNGEFASSYSSVSLKVYNNLSNLTFISSSSLSFTGGNIFKAKLTNNGIPLKNLNIGVKLLRVSSGASKTYNIISDNNGEVFLNINLAKGLYYIYCFFEGSSFYESSYCNVSLNVF